MRPSFRSGIQQFFLPVLFAGLLTACSSSSDSSSSSADTSSVSGSVVAAPVAGASLTVKDVNGNSLAGPVSTNADGSYTVDVPASAMAGTLVFEATGGNYTDEASGQSATAGTLAAIVDGAAVTAGGSVHLTPASTIVQRLVTQHGLTLAQAKDRFEQAFGFAADTDVKPEDATAPAADASNEEKLAGLRAAAFSQLTADLGLAAGQQFDLLDVLADDLADGSLDGSSVNGAVSINAGMSMPADIRNRFTGAMMTFHASTADKTGLGNDQIGVPVFATVASSNTYTVTYVPGAMGAMEGKTMFTLKVTDAGGGAVTGLSPTLMPMMHMGSGMMHSAPTTGCSENMQNPGEYDCTVYYLMASTMAGGMSMGYWELDVMLGMNESVTFYPKVMMAMGDTPKVLLKGQTGVDMIMSMDGEMNRRYYVFREGLSGMGNARTFTMFIAAMESMKRFSAVAAGTVLNPGTMYEYTATPMTVEASTDGSTWVTATNDGNGYWSVTPLAGLVDGNAGKIYLRLTVGGDRKTTNGAAPAGDGSNDYAAFTVTPGGMM